MSYTNTAVSYNRCFVNYMCARIFFALIVCLAFESKILIIAKHFLTTFFFCREKLQSSLITATHCFE